MRQLILKRREDRRLRAGHLWIFSNEVDVKQSSLTEFAPGEAARVLDSAGQSLGTAYVNPASLICARLVSRQDNTPLDGALLRQRLHKALALRAGLFDQPYYRLCHGEGDFLPGLVVDRYGDVLAVQMSTAGMEACRDVLLEELAQLLRPSCIALRNDIAARQLENLPQYNETALGTAPDFLDIPENGATFRVPFAEGQKTGWFFDQRRNRAEAARYAKGRRVLDAFCYAGGFGVAAAVGGAASVTFMDASRQALDASLRNLGSNTSCSPMQGEIIHGDALQELAKLREQIRQGERPPFGLVSIDPPAFIKRRKDAATGLAAYRKINALALDLLDVTAENEQGGVLVTSSCSHHLEAAALLQCVHMAAAKRGLHSQILWQGTQGPDHPIHACMPETAYLKCLVARFWR